MATRLSIYKGALLLLGERTIEDLSEDTPSRYDLDLVWDRNGVKYCLERGFWKFALRTVKLDYDTSIETAFGFRRAFQKDTDYVRTAGVYQDEFLEAPLTRYSDEVGYIYADLDEIYVQYVSSHADFGMNLTQWPETFTKYVEHYFAYETCEKITGSRVKKSDMKADIKKALMEARSNDAMQGPAKFMPPGSWTQARLGRQGSRGYRHSGWR